MKTRSGFLLAGLATLAACATPQPAPLVAPAAVAPAPAANIATASLGAPGGASAAVRLVSPKAAYGVLLLSLQPWLATDILEYTVILERQTAPAVLGDPGTPATFDAANGVTVTVPVVGPNAKTAATFTSVPFGNVYRAFVTALGNHGGIVDPVTFANSTLTTLNTTPATADFDFTLPQNQGVTLTQATQVVFDPVVFAGQGTVTFNAPDGVFVSPGAPIAGSATNRAFNVE